MTEQAEGEGAGWSLEEGMNGKAFLDALKYVLLACPKGDDNEALSHVVFAKGKAISGDGYRWHIAYLPEGYPVGPPVVAQRESVLEVAVLCEAAKKIVGKEGVFRVEMEGLVCKVRYQEDEMQREMLNSVVGVVPEDWEPPVSADDPLTDPGQMSAALVSEATKWPETICEYHGGGEKPLRIDLTSMGERVATAVILPIGNRATLPDEEQDELFKERGARGNSILSATLDKVTHREDRVGDAPSDPEPAKPKKGKKKPKGEK